MLNGFTARFRSSLLVLAPIVVALVLAGCAATTQIINQWQDPKATGTPVKRLLVIGVTKQAGIRRTFEDEFVRQLSALGVQAEPSYRFVPQDGEVPQERLAQAVKDSGVDSVLITRLVKVDKATQVYPGSYFGPPAIGFYGYYSAAWVGFYDPPQIYTYDVVTAETNLFEAGGDTLIWSGTTETFSPRDVAKDTHEFVAVIVKALHTNGLI